MSASRFIMCITIDDGPVRKTCLLIFYTNNSFHTVIISFNFFTISLLIQLLKYIYLFPLCSKYDYLPIVFDNFSANVVVNGSTVNLGLWDTVDYNKLRSLSYRGIDVFILAFYFISKASNANISKKWIPELKHYAPEVPIAKISYSCFMNDSEFDNL
uniref:Uncharacterized protein n=1 Tax=Lactuca sativa TaxID=4236 RepID=A0A9R1WYJ3_LACSA|nr:hypothetical protein LSAT_V11C800443530 [Lactuca sativa]